MIQVGAGGQHRTDDLLFTRQALCHLSYTGSESGGAGVEPAFRASVWAVLARPILPLDEPPIKSIVFNRRDPAIRRCRAVSGKEQWSGGVESTVEPSYHSGVALSTTFFCRYLGRACECPPQTCVHIAVREDPRCSYRLWVVTPSEIHQIRSHPEVAGVVGDTRGPVDRVPSRDPIVTDLVVES